MTPPDLAEIWVYLSQKPLTGLTLTLCAYAAGDWLYEKTGRYPLLNPVPIAIAMIAGLLWLTDVPYADYFEGAQFVHFLLGPATVALAVPLYQHLAELRKSGPALIVGILAGSITASGCAVGFAWLGGASTETLLSIAPKSVTAPIAMGIAEQLGGLPSLTAVLVILTGITGALFGPLVLNLVRIKDWRGARPRHGCRRPRHRHRPRAAGQPHRRRLRRPRHGPQRLGDGNSSTADFCVGFLSRQLIQLRTDLFAHLLGRNEGHAVLHDVAGTEARVEDVGAGFFQHVRVFAPYRTSSAGTLRTTAPSPTDWLCFHRRCRGRSRVPARTTHGDDRSHQQRPTRPTATCRASRSASPHNRTAHRRTGCRLR